MPPLRLSELAGLDDDERNRRIEAHLARRWDSPSEGLAEVNRAIAAYEQRYEMSSGEMLRRLRDGRQGETADIFSWLMLLEVRNGRKES